MSAGELKKRIGALAEDSAAGDAVAKAVSTAVSAALMAAMTPVIVAATIT